MESQKRLRPKTQLKKAENLAAKYPLFADQLAPELPKLREQVSQFGNQEPPTEPRFEVGQHVRYQPMSWHKDTYTGIIKSRSPSWDYSTYNEKFSGWDYYVCFDEGQVPAAFSFMHKLPCAEKRLTLLS